MQVSTKIQTISCANIVSVLAVSVSMEAKTVRHVKTSVVSFIFFTTQTMKINVYSFVLMVSTVRNPTIFACHVMQDASYAQDPQMIHVQNASQQQ
jgi:hypothetical protein